MAIPLQVFYRDVPQSDTLNALIVRETAKLERYFPRVVNCRVSVEHLSRRHRTGSPYHLRIVLSVPGHELVITQVGDVQESVAVRAAFRKAKRQLQDYARLIAS